MKSVLPYVFFMIGLLMIGHLLLIYVDLSGCYWLMKMRVEEIGAAKTNLGDTGCHTIEATYQEAVDKYLAIALALAGGGTAGAVMTRRNDNDN